MRPLPKRRSTQGTSRSKNYETRLSRNNRSVIMRGMWSSTKRSEQECGSGIQHPTTLATLPTMVIYVKRQWRTMDFVPRQLLRHQGEVIEVSWHLNSKDFRVVYNGRALLRSVGISDNKKVKSVALKLCGYTLKYETIEGYYCLTEDHEVGKIKKHLHRHFLPMGHTRTLYQRYMNLWQGE